MKNMRSRPSVLTLVSLYAIIATSFLISHHFVGDISKQLKEANHYIDEDQYYANNFLPSEHKHHHATDTDYVVAHPSSTKRAKFPIKRHIVTQGKPRTATTLLFNMVAASYFLYLVENDPEQIADVELKYWQRPKGYKELRRAKTKSTFIIKAHISLDNFLSDNAVVFTAAIDREEAEEMRTDLERDGHTVAFIQDMESVKEGGVPRLVDEYVAGYGLSEKDKTNLIDYFSSWEILRQCCGQQMSAKWRNDMVPEEFKISKFKSHPTCAGYDIDEIERTFMATELYSMINQYSSVRPLNKASLNDGYLDGTYCSSYNYLVRTQGLSIWGVPGGRPSRTKLDGAIKEQMKLGKEGLPSHLQDELFPPTDLLLKQRMTEMWKRPENEKKEWLKAVVAARNDGTDYSDYGIPPTTDSMDTEEREEITDDNRDREDGLESVMIANVESDDDINEKSSTNSGEVSTQSTADDNTHAIFLISFGEEAAASTLTERCILSLRRRGNYNGFIILLTDAPPERYQNEWDDNVIVMHPLDEHLNREDGKRIKYTRDNTSLKPKRFKTFIIDYMSMDKRLDSVELIYYLDIDIMAGNDIPQFFTDIENKYKVSRIERDEEQSKLFFFTPLSKEWPVQGGTFIVERGSSRRCLELWRKEIDALTISGRGRDQDALRTIHDRIQTGQEDKCELVRMANEQFIAFPTARTFKKLAKQTNFPSLVHISNSVFAKWIDEAEQTEYINRVLQLSEAEKTSGNYGKIVVNTYKSDM